MDRDEIVALATKFDSRKGRRPRPSLPPTPALATKSDIEAAARLYDERLARASAYARARRRVGKGGQNPMWALQNAAIPASSQHGLVSVQHQVTQHQAAEHAAQNELAQHQLAQHHLNQHHLAQQQLVQQQLAQHQLVQQQLAQHLNQHHFGQPHLTPAQHQHSAQEKDGQQSLAPEHQNGDAQQHQHILMEGAVDDQIPDMASNDQVAVAHAGDSISEHQADTVTEAEVTASAVAAQAIAEAESAVAFEETVSTRGENLEEGGAHISEPIQHDIAGRGDQTAVGTAPNAPVDPIVANEVQIDESHPKGTHEHATLTGDMQDQVQGNEAQADEVQDNIATLKKMVEGSTVNVASPEKVEQVLSQALNYSPVIGFLSELRDVSHDADVTPTETAPSKRPVQYDSNSNTTSAPEQSPSKKARS